MWSCLLRCVCLRSVKMSKFEKRMTKNQHKKTIISSAVHRFPTFEMGQLNWSNKNLFFRLSLRVCVCVCVRVKFYLAQISPKLKYLNDANYFLHFNFVAVTFNDERKKPMCTHCSDKNQETASFIMRALFSLPL